MSSDAENLVRVNQLKFIAKIVSIYAHDLNNQLGTIKEVSGLMEDLVERSNAKDSRLKEDLARPLRSIYGRVGDAAFITSKLDTLCRGMERPAQAFQIHEAIGTLLALVRRLAVQRRIELVTDFQAEIPAVHADPFMFQFLLFCLMEDQLMRLKPKSRLVFRTVRSGKVVSVMILPEGEADQSDEKRTFPDGMAHLIAETCGFSLVPNGRDSRINLNL